MSKDSTPSADNDRTELLADFDEWAADCQCDRIADLESAPSCTAKDPVLAAGYRAARLLILSAAALKDGLERSFPPHRTTAIRTLVSLFYFQAIVDLARPLIPSLRAAQQRFPKTCIVKAGSVTRGNPVEAILALIDRLLVHSRNFQFDAVYSAAKAALDGEPLKGRPNLIVRGATYFIWGKAEGVFESAERENAKWWELVNKRLRRRLAAFDGEELLARFDSEFELVATANNESADTQIPSPTDTELSVPPPLTANEQAVYDLIPTWPNGITGKQILAALAKKGMVVEQGTLTKHFIPRLKKWYHVDNRHGVGYYRKPT